MKVTQLKDIVIFRDDLYFDGAVQADWFYQERQIEAVAKSFVFHGPQNHAVSQTEFGGHGLMDTASFALRLAGKMEKPEEGSAMTLAIAGYGTGKSHLAVTLSTLFSGEQWMPSLHEAILNNVSRADAGIANALRPLVKKPRLVLTLNGMRDFNLHYELLRTAEKALRLYGSNLDVLSKLNKVKETATSFVERSFDLLHTQFMETAATSGLSASAEMLKECLLSGLDEPNGIAFDVVNQVYTEFNGHPIRLDEGVSAGSVLDTLLQDCCGLHGQFDSIVILFDEFGRFLEYVSENPTAAGDSALQQIFESIQNAEGEIQFVGFIQSDIKSYLQRVDKSSNISRYIDRYDAGEKVYLSSNLETIFANLLEKKNPDLYRHVVLSRFDAEASQQRLLFNNLQKWLPLHGVWNGWPEYKRIILESIYPLHPLSTYLLCHLTNWLQSRSSLTLLSEKLRLMGDMTLDPAKPLPIIYPAELLKGSFFDELLNAEEQGRQRSQFCILLNSIYRKFDTKLTEEAKSILLSNLVLRICHFHFEQRDDLLEALCLSSGLSIAQVETALQLLEDEYAVLSYDDRLICFDFVADSVGANEFRNFLRAAQNRRSFHAEMLMQNDIQECAGVLTPIVTEFGPKHGIQTREWSFVQHIDSMSNACAETVNQAYLELKTHTLPNMERGSLLWLYASKETPTSKIDELVEIVKDLGQMQAVVVMVLDDTDNSLQDAILAYRVLADMKDEDKSHYQRFYADALDKAREKVSLLFADLKQQRKAITAGGVEATSKRLKSYLSEIFETIYPKVIPFDFEGFDTKTASGAAYKNYCTVLKWILVEHMSYISLKSQSSDVKNRIESLLGPHGQFSWRALNQEYKSIVPANAAVSKLYSAIESILTTKKVVPFKQIAAKLTSAPYGMNEYSAFLFLSLFSELCAYTTRLEYDDTKYSTVSWAEIVLQDKKYDTKVFGKTRLLLIDVGETIGRYRQIYTRIKKNTDFTKILGLREELDKLKLEEAVPEALEAEDDLATMLLSEGDKVRKVYIERIMNIDSSLHKAKKDLNPYSALQVAFEAQKLRMETFSSGRFVYSTEQLDELDGYIEMAKMIAAASFADGWIKRFNCSGADKLGSYKAFASKAEDLFDHYGFTRESIEMASKVNLEVARIQLMIDQEALINNCEQYMLTSQIRQGMTQENLSAFVDQANDFLSEFKKFDYESAQNFVELRMRILGRIEELSQALKEFKTQLDAIWNALNDISCVDDVQHVHARIEAILGSGLTEGDRQDFEKIDHELNQFLADTKLLYQRSLKRSELQSVCDEMKTQYSHMEIDVTPVIDGIFAELHDVMERQETTWTKEFLMIEPSDMSQAALDKWKHDTQPLPSYVSSEVASRYATLASAVDQEISKQRVEYIVLLFSQLSDSEKEECREEIAQLNNK